MPSANQVFDVALEEFWLRQRLPTRKWNKWLTVGDAIGTFGGAAIWYIERSQEEKAACKATEYKNYKRICDQSPPPGLSGKALDKWNLKKTLACWKARRDFTDKWHDGEYDIGHEKYMDQLKSTISRLSRKLGL